MANLANLVNFSAGSLAVGDWTYSAYGLTAPSYLPLNNETVSYLASSYPTLAALYTTPVTAYAATARSSANTTYGDKSIAYGNGVWVASDGYFQTSFDGINWATRNANVGMGPIVFGNGIFVTLARTGTTFWYSSTDGSSWTVGSNSFVGPYVDLAYGNKVFIAIGGPTASSLTRVTTDGLSTSGNALLPSSSTWSCISYGAVGSSNFVALASYSTSAAYTGNNGISWAASTSPSAAAWSSVAYGNGTFVAVSGGPKGDTAVNSTSAATSTDFGVTWTARTLPVSQAWTSVTFGNGLFFAVGYTTGSTGTTAATSPDGITWTTRVLPSSRAWGCVAIGGPTNNQFFVVADTATINMATINLSVAQTTFTLPPVPILKNTVPYIKAT